VAPTGRTKFVFFVVGLALLTSFALTFTSGQKATVALDQLSRTTTLLRALERVNGAISEADARGYAYLYSGLEQDAVLAAQALKEVPNSVKNLQGIATEEDIPPAEMDRLKQLITKELEFLQQSLDLRRGGQTDAALALMQNVEGERTNRAALQVLRDWRSTADSQRARLTEQAGVQTDFRTLVYFSVLVVNLLFLAWAYHTLQQEMRQRREMAEENGRQRDLLAVTLASIGDAVIQTDNKGVITYLNWAAEELTGWKLAEAVGLPCSKVFNIINEDTRRPVESPVDTVLATGNVVGLANHTLLIRKDGVEIPIDDSGAPIRRPGGRILGVVLVFRDFTVHKRAESEIQHARDEQAAANHAKDQFIAALSHELRTPLTPVLGTLRLWERSPDLPDSLMPDVFMMRRNIEMETRLIDDLLDMTRIEKGKMPLKEEVVDAHLLLAAVESIFKDEIFSRDGDFKNDYGAADHFVRVDPARFQQVLWNVLGNALKFTPKGRKISVRTSNARAGELTITFEDEGIGMSPDTAAKIFLPFEQGSDNTRRTRGLGLGLAIAKSIVEAHGGRMEGNSAGPQRGSTFLVHLPTVIPTPAEEKAATPPVAQALETERPLGPVKVLLVEDHADTAYVISRVLRASGYEVVVCSNLALAVDLAREYSFGVLLSDIGLKDGSGLDLMREVRKFSAIPSIALTGYGMKEDVDKCREAGFTDHLTKPVDIDQLLRAIENVLTGATPPRGLPN
jgi:PAS domain S-box-containing protein